MAILTVDQLPDSRRSILIALKQSGPATIAELSNTLKLTGEAVRQQLLQLRRDGWIDVKQLRGVGDRRIGRPAAVYCLSEAGDHLFPKHYDALAIVMIDAVAEKLGPEALIQVLESVADAKVSEIAPHLQGLPLPDKMAKLKSWYLPDDPYMTTEAGETGYRLVERNCPFLNTALRRPALCSVSVNALTKLLGVRVEREEKFQNGAGRCVFRVHPEQPVDAASWQFRLESEMPSGPLTVNGSTPS